MIFATITRACLEAAIGNVDVTPTGCFSPASCTPTQASYFAATDYAMMVRHLHDIAGGTVATGPSFADLDNPETGPYVGEVPPRRMAGVSAEQRMALFHAIRNMTADEWGGREAVRGSNPAVGCSPSAP